MAYYPFQSIILHLYCINRISNIVHEKPLKPISVWIFFDTNYRKPSNYHTSSFIDTARHKENSFSNKIDPPLLTVVYAERNRRNRNQYLSAINHEIWEKFVHTSISLYCICSPFRDLKNTMKNEIIILLNRSKWIKNQLFLNLVYKSFK